MKFALINLFKQKKLTLINGLTIVCISMICYVFMAMLYDPYLALDTSDLRKMYMGAGTTLFIIIFSLCLMCYTSFYVIESKSKELSLMVFHGMTLKKMIFYQVYQNTFMYLIFGVLGISIGYFITPMIIQFIYNQLNQQATISFTNETIFQTIDMMGVMYVITLIVNVGYIYRSKLASMLTNVRQNQYRRKNIFRIPDKAYLIIYFSGLIMMFTTEHNSVGYIIFSIIGGIGGYGIMRYFIPDFIEEMKSSEWLNNSHNLIVFGELFLKLKFIGLFLQLLILISIILTTLICYNFNNLLEMNRMMIAYFIMIPMIFFCITYKNIILSKRNHKNLVFIYKLGMIKKMEEKLIRKELFYLYGLLLILPMIYIIPTLFRFYIYDNISMKLICILISYFTINLIISMLISYQSTKQVLKEV